VRPDRLTNALFDYVQEEMGLKFVEQTPFDIIETEKEMNPQTPTFFVLFPGVDPTPEVELIAGRVGKSLDNEKFINISMG
jgi:dynein heavy chain